MAKKRRVYGDLNTISDISEINREIRNAIKKLKHPDAIQERVRQSLYLYSLLHTPHIRPKFEGKMASAEKEAKDQYTQTANLANRRMASMGKKKRFDNKIGK